MVKFANSSGKTLKSLVSFVATFVAFMMVFVSTFTFNIAVTFAAVPNTLNYQSRLRDAGGVAVNVATNIKFTFYDALTGGSVLWSETYDQAAGACQSITPDADGYFAVALGSCSGFPASLDFTDEVFLGVSIGADPEATPRVLIGAHPYARNSHRVGDFVAAAIGLLKGEATGLADAANLVFDSAVLAFEGSAWDGVAALALNMKLKNTIIDSTNYKLSVLNNADSEVFSVDESGNTVLSGAMIINNNANDLPLSMLKTAAGRWLGFNDGTDDFGFYNSDGTPEGVVLADTGSISLDTTNGDIYIKTTDGVNTGWAELLKSDSAVWHKVATSISADNLSPTDPTINTVTLENNTAGQLTMNRLIHTDDTSNYAGAVFEVKGSGPDYTNNMYFGKYGDSFWVPEWAGKGVMATDQDLVIGSMGTNDATNPNPDPEITFQVGGGYNTPNNIATLNAAGWAFNTGVRILEYLDEDDFASDSDTALATQQSIKKYVDDAVDTTTHWEAGSGGDGIRTVENTSAGGDATGSYSVAEGRQTTASGNWGSHAEGFRAVASGAVSHAEGFNTTVSGSAAHVEGNGSTASGSRSHAEGDSTTAAGSGSHSEGRDTSANGDNSHAEGDGTIAQNASQHSAGMFNVGTSNETIHETGIGVDDANRANAFEIYTDGTLTAPESTVALINARGVKTLTTKEYVDGRVGTSIFDTDADTGIQVEANPDDDNIRMQTAGTQRFRINDAGRVAIGDNLNSITALLEVGGPAESSVFAVSGDSSYGNIATFRDQDGENVFRAQGSLGNDDLVVTFGDYDQAYGGSSMSVNAGSGVDGHMDLVEMGLRFYDSANNNAKYVGFNAPAAVATDLSWTLPDSDGANNEALITDGAGNLSWGAVPINLTANNGLTKTGSNIKLGGTLTEDTTIDMSGNEYELSFDSGPNNSRTTIDGWAFYTTDLSNNNSLSFTPDGLKLTNNGNRGFIKNYDGKIGVTSDNPVFEGMSYDADYSANYTDRSLVDKAYVDTHQGTLQQAFDSSIAADGYVEGTSGAALWEDDGGAMKIEAKNGGFEVGMREEGGSGIFFQTSNGGVPAKMHINDARVGVDQIGIVYDNDYSANFVDRSLVDKAYVDNSILSSTNWTQITDGGTNYLKPIATHNAITFGTGGDQGWVKGDDGMLEMGADVIDMQASSGLGFSSDQIDMKGQFRLDTQNNGNVARIYTDNLTAGRIFQHPDYSGDYVVTNNAAAANGDLLTWNGSQWAVTNPSSYSNNIYTGDGQIVGGDRTVDLNGNYLNFENTNLLLEIGEDEWIQSINNGTNLSTELSQDAANLYYHVHDSTTDAHNSFRVSTTGVELKASPDNGATGTTSLISDGAITFSSDNAAFPGAVYAADYSANFVDRTLVDKAYVDTAIIGAAPWERDSINGYVYPKVLGDNIGIGTNSPSDKLTVYDGNLKVSQDGNDPQLILEGRDQGFNWVIGQDEAENIQSGFFYIGQGANVDATNAQLLMRETGHLYLDTTHNLHHGAHLSIMSDGINNMDSTEFIGMASDTKNPELLFYRARNNSAAEQQILDNDVIGKVGFTGPVSSYVPYTFISGVADEDWAPGSRGGKLEFFTSANGTELAVNRLTIENDGTLNVAGTTDYENLVLHDDDLPNKKYVDDAIISGNVNLYNGDGQIIGGDRTVDLNGNSLYFENTNLNIEFNEDEFVFEASDANANAAYSQDPNGSSYNSSSAGTHQSANANYRFDNLSFSRSDDDNATRTTLKVDTTNIPITSTVANFQGAIYGDDYSANFVDRTLVDKAYVDNQVTAGVTASNGLTKNVADVQLGGALDTDTYIETAKNKELYIANPGHTSYVHFVNDEITLADTVANKSSKWNNNAFSFQDTATGFSDIVTSVNDGMKIMSNNPAFVGAYYDADYSANYTVRSLVDKEYVDSKVGSSIYDTDLDTGIETEHTADDDAVRFYSQGQEIIKAMNPGGNAKRIMFGDYDEDGNGTYLDLMDGGSVIRFNGLTAELGDTEGNGNETFLAIDDATQLASLNNASFELLQNGADTGELLMREDIANGTNYVGFKSAAALGGNQVWTLPTADGAANDVLYTDGAGGLGWKAATNENIYNIDGVLTGDRTVDINGNVLSFGNTNLLMELSADEVNSGIDDGAGATTAYMQDMMGFSFSTQDANTGKSSYMQARSSDLVFTRSDDSDATRTTLKVDTTNIPITSTVANFQGAIYGDDYSADYTNRSLVDKEYVDNSIDNNVTASNGVTEVAGDIQLGGDLTSNVTINSTGNEYGVVLNSVVESSTITNDGATITARTNDGVHVTEFSPISWVTQDLNTGHDIRVSSDSLTFTHTNNKTFTSRADSVEIGGQPTFLGLTYDADYSGNFVDRSLIDKAYVDNALASAASPFVLTSNVTSNGDGDYTNDDFVYGSPSLSDDGDNNHDRRFFFDKSKGAFRAGYTTSDEWDDANVGISSIALGGGYIDGEGSITPAPIASGDRSIALGMNSVASGDGSFAVIRSNANSDGSFAAVNGTTNASNSVAMTGGTTNASNSVAMAGGTTNGTYAVAMGGGSSAASYSVAMGYNTTASGQDAVSMGQNSTASALGTVAMGIASEASGEVSVAMGKGALARSYGEVALGLYTTDYVADNSVGFDVDDRLFVIGNGTDNANRSDAFTMYKDGLSTFSNVASYSSDLSASYTDRSLVDKAYVDAQNTNSWDVDGDTGIQVEESADEDMIRFDIGDSSGSAHPDAMVINSDGNIGVGTVDPSETVTLYGDDSDLEFESASENAGTHRIYFKHGNDSATGKTFIQSAATGANSNGNLSFNVANSDMFDIFATGSIWSNVEHIFRSNARLGSSTNSGVKYIKFSPSEAKAAIFSVPAGSFGRADLRFTVGDDGVATEKTENDYSMIIARNGDIGIGDAITPSSKLHVDSGAANTSAIMTLANTNGDMQMFRTDATPESDITGSIGDLAVDSTNGKIYIKETGNATNTGWTALSGGGVSEINDLSDGKTDDFSVFLGTNAGLNNTSGDDNRSTALGYDSLRNNTTGNYNTAVGYSSLKDNTTGNNNTSVGLFSMYLNTTGSNNAALGYNSGRYTSSFAFNETSSNSVYLGTDSKSGADGNTNEVVIGYDARGIGSNSVVLGNDSISTTALKGDVLIGGTSSSTANVILSKNTSVVFNEQARSNIDFRVEGENDANMIFVDASEDKIGIGTDTLNAKLTVDGNVMLHDSGSVPTAVANYSGLYSSGGELFALDASGNSTQISPHDKKTNEWVYNSKNIKTGKSLYVNMEAMMMAFDEVLGGGYVFVDGKAYHGSGDIDRNTIEELKNITVRLKSIDKMIDDLKKMFKKAVFKSLKVSGKAEFAGEVIFNKDTVGYAKVKAGKEKVKVKFKNKYSVRPVITLTVMGLPIDGLDYGVLEVNKSGFTIGIDGKYKNDIQFAWHAFAGANVKIPKIDLDERVEKVDEEKADAEKVEKKEDAKEIEKAEVEKKEHDEKDADKKESKKIMMDVKVSPRSVVKNFENMDDEMLDGLDLGLLAD